MLRSEFPAITCDPGLARAARLVMLAALVPTFAVPVWMFYSCLPPVDDAKSELSRALGLLLCGCGAVALAGAWIHAYALPASRPAVSSSTCNRCGCRLTPTAQSCPECGESADRTPALASQSCRGDAAEFDRVIRRFRLVASVSAAASVVLWFVLPPLSGVPVPFQPRFLALVLGFVAPPAVCAPDILKEAWCRRQQTGRL